MKLSQLFSGEVRTDSTSSRASQLTPAQMEQASRQIRSLVPGQTISGEIVSRNGSEVQIRLSEDLLLNARVDRNLNIEVGKNMTFEVKNNGSSLTLSPLFTNVATDVNVLKALDMAGLPVNRASIDMTQQLMQAGMSVNRSSLQQIFREINGFPQAEISDIINLHRLQMPVNEANLNQMVSYRNLNHQLTQGMDTILEALPEAFDSMMEQGDAAGAVKLYQEVLRLVQESGGELTLAGAGGGIPEGTGGMSGTDLVQGVFSDVSGSDSTAGDLSGISGPGFLQGELSDITGALFTEGEITAGNLTGEGRLTGAENRLQADPEAILAGLVQEEQAEIRDMLPSKTADQTIAEPGTGAEGASAVKEEPVLNGRTAAGTDPGLNAGQMLSEAGIREQVPDSLRMPVANEALALLDSIRMPPEEAFGLRSQILQFARGEMDAGQFFSLLNGLADGAKFSTGSMKQLERMFSEPRFRTFLSHQLKGNWMLRPEEVSVPGRVEEMYRRLDRQLRSLGSALEDAGQTGSTAYRAVSSMSQNIDFLQQLNQMYTYVQLPLRLQQRDAQGELYVYTNKKKLASPDGTVSALLHLDMEHLGPVDVHVSLKGSRVNTRFYLRDDEMIDFMSQHMDVLTGRLQKRGYDCSFSMTLREKGESEATKGGLEPVLRQNKGIMLSHYAFDVRT